MIRPVTSPSTPAIASPAAIRPRLAPMWTARVLSAAIAASATSAAVGAMSVNAASCGLELSVLLSRCQIRNRLASPTAALPTNSAAGDSIFPDRKLTA